MTNRYGRFAVTTALGLALATLAGRAYADEPPAAAPPAEGTPPGDATAPPPATTPPPAATSPGSSTDVTLGVGQINVNGDVVIGLYKDFAGKPISIVPNLYYGVNNQLTVGIAHNPIADTFAVAGLARGLCLSGESDGCAKLYNNLSLDALYSFMREATMDLAGHGGIDFDSLDPLWMKLRVGVKGQTLAGPVMIIFDPFVSFGLTKRSEGNKENLGIPVRFAFAATPELNVNVTTGVFAPFDGFGDNYAIPVALGAGYRLNSQLALRAQFSFDNLLGKVPEGAGRADQRTLAIGASFNM